MPTPQSDDIVSPGEDVFNLILEYYDVSSFSEVPKNSIKNSNIKFYKVDNNSENDYLIINFIKNSFKSWNKLSWFETVFSLFKIRSFKLKRNEYNFLREVYIRNNYNEEPNKFNAVYCVGKIKPFIIFFFELFDGPGTEGNSVGIKIPKGAV